MASNGNQLDNKQRKAIAALLSTRNVPEAAQQAGVGARTLYRWLAEDEAFKVALAAEEGRAIDAATRRLIALQESAIAVIVQLMASRDTPPGVRLRAATACLDYLLKIRELRNIEERLAALEGALHGHGTH